MVYYPDCSFCENTSLSIVDVEVNGVPLKGIQCNSCGKFVGFYKDDLQKLNEFSEALEDLESRVSDLE